MLPAWCCLYAGALPVAGLPSEPAFKLAGLSFDPALQMNLMQQVGFSRGSTAHRARLFVYCLCTAFYYEVTPFVEQSTLIGLSSDDAIRL